MDVAHELGHLTMHWQGIERSRSTEQEAQDFGGAFLMPAEDVTAHCPYNATLVDIMTWKRRWGVSVAALAYRLHKLGMITDWRYRSLFIALSTRGYRKSEPNPMRSEQSEVLRQVLQANADYGRTQEDIAKDLAIPLSDLYDITFALAPKQATHPTRERVVANDKGSPVERPNLRVIEGGRRAQ